MLTGFHTIKTGNKRNVNIFRRFNGKPLMYVFPWKVTYNGCFLGENIYFHILGGVATIRLMILKYKILICKKKQ